MKHSHVSYYPDGSIRAKGNLKDGKRNGYWKWYRKDGSKMKVGFFTNGTLTKAWMKYDIRGILIKKS
jgi:antitoxin component YwqK of YwqJK toxin-antitoxin module